MVTQFFIKYIDYNGVVMVTPITDPDKLINIKLIEITMEVQSPFAVILNPDQNLHQHCGNRRGWHHRI